MTKRLTFVVVTCEKDLDLFKRYLVSLEAFCIKEELEEIICVFNDHFRYLKECEDITKAFDMPIRVIWSNHLWPEQNQYDWYSQQQLKLLVSLHVQTEWYIVNDSKDYYIARIGYSDFIQDQMSLQQVCDVDNGHDPWFGPHGLHKSQYENAYDLFGLKFSNCKFAVRTSSASTFPLRTTTIQDLVVHLRQQFGVLFRYLLLLQLDNRPMFTEYALISAWLEKNNLLFENYCAPSFMATQGFQNKVMMSKDLRRGQQI